MRSRTAGGVMREAAQGVLAREDAAKELVGQYGAIVDRMRRACAP